MAICKSINCGGKITTQGEDFCPTCKATSTYIVATESSEQLSKKYPKYFKDVSDVAEVDVYAVHQLFNIQDPSGCIQHASKKLLLSGVRTGGKSAFKDIQEAKDTLTRWLQLNPDHNQ